MKYMIPPLAAFRIIKDFAEEENVPIERVMATLEVMDAIMGELELEESEEESCLQEDKQSKYWTQLKN